MNATEIIALFSGIVAMGIAASTAMNTSRKAEVDSLHNTIKTLSSENHRLELRIVALEQQNRILSDIDDRHRAGNAGQVNEDA